MADEREGAFAAAEAEDARGAATLVAAQERSGPRPSAGQPLPPTQPVVEDVTRTGVVAVTGGRMPRPGASLFEAGDMVDHFEVKRLLGQGGMGAVYLAVDTKLGRRVALKVVQPEFLGSAKAVESFLFEARTTARFNHAHIVTVYAVGEHQGRPYVALEYLEGETLQQILRKRRLTLDEALATGLAIADALAEAHAHDVLHRDLKPANVLIPADGRLRVLDFGLAKRVQDSASPPSSRLMSFGPRDYTWAGAGTPAYMAPEQWRADASTVATDVWALGVLLFEVIAGKRPFDEESLDEQERIVTGDAEAPRLSGFADVPEELADLIARCLAKDPAARPTATEVAALLRALSGSERAPRVTIPVSSRRSDPGASPNAPTVRAPDTTRRDAPAPSGGAEITAPSPGAAPPARRSLLLVALAALALGAGAVSLWRPPAPPTAADKAVPVVNVVTPEPPPAETAAPAAPPPSAPATATSAAPRTAPASPPPARRPFDRDVAMSNMERIAKSAAFVCKHHDGPRAFTVNVTFGPHGSPEEVSVSHGAPGFVGLSGACVRSQFYRASVPAYDGPRERVSVGVALP